MTAEQQEDLPKAKFDNLVEALDWRHKCPVCTSTLLKESNVQQLRDDPDYILVVRNVANTSDQVKVAKDGKTALLVSQDTLFWKNGLVNFPLRIICDDCKSYTHNLRLVLDTNCNPNMVKEILLISVTLTLSHTENIIIRSHYNSELTRLYVNNKEYPIEFMDFDPTKKQELYERFSAIVPFI